MAAVTGLGFVVVSVGIACVVGVAATALALPALRRYDARAAVSP